MMEVTVIEPALVLIPNKEHQNFTATRDIIPVGTKLRGESQTIKGLRRGQEQVYRVFKIENTNQYIYINKIKPKTMSQTVDVMLGADKSVSPTVVNVPANKRANQIQAVGSVIGAIAGFTIAKKRNVTGNQKWIYVGVGALAGYLVAKMVVKHKEVTIKK